MRIEYHDWDAEPIPRTRLGCLEQIVAIQRELHGLANRLASLTTVLERLDG